MKTVLCDVSFQSGSTSIVNGNGKPFLIQSASCSLKSFKSESF